MLRLLLLEEKKFGGSQTEIYSINLERGTATGGGLLGQSSSLTWAAAVAVFLLWLSSSFDSRLHLSAARYAVAGALLPLPLLLLDSLRLSARPAIQRSLAQTNV